MVWFGGIEPPIRSAFAPLGAGAETGVRQYALSHFDAKRERHQTAGNFRLLQADFEGPPLISGKALPMLKM